MGSRLESNSSAVRKRIEKHDFRNEEGEEYEASNFGGFTDYFRRKKIKLQNLDALRRSSSTDKPQIFRGVVAHVNGYTQPSLNDLHAMIVDHGGAFMQYLDGKTTVTHILAGSLTPKKKVEFRRYRVVKPAWVVHSIQAGRLLPWTGYRVVDEGEKQQVLGLESGNIMSQASSQYAGYRDQMHTSWYTSQVKDAAHLLDMETSGLELLPPRRQTLSPDLADGNSPLKPMRPPMLNSLLDKKKPRSIHSPTLSVHTDPFSDLDVASPIGGLHGLDNVHYHDIAQLPSDSGLLFAQEPPTAPNDLGMLDTKANSMAMVAGSKALAAEEHNAKLLADPMIWKSTVVNPGFLKQYYEESRLHHLSTWKAELKSQLQALAEEKSAPQKSQRKRPPGSRRYILHVDFDSFFAAVSLRKYPQYVEKPAVVAHGGGSGSEIASCNYPARKYGVKNGMWMKTAQELCPELKVLPYDFQAYEQASRAFYDVIMNVGGIVQSVSVDEALVDVTTICIEAGGHDGNYTAENGVYLEQTKADEIAKDIRAQIKQRTGCAVSVGIGGNILLSKVALRRAKPAGQYHLKPEEVHDFIGALPIQDLPGVARSLGGKLEEIGIKLVRDVREVTKERMISTLGPKTGEKIWEYSQGVDHVEVGEQGTRKSVSADVNWGIRFVTQEQADEFVRSMCEELHRRLMNEGVKGRQFTMKIMRRAAGAPLDPPKHLGHGKCDTFNKSVALGVASNEKEVLSREALSIMRGFGFPPGELRGIGVQMTRLEPLKSMGSLIESSQKRLNFEKKREPSAAKAINDEHRDDEFESPSLEHPGGALSGSPAEGEPRALLNTLGTQFVLPSQVDADVLAELPGDIRSKLMAKSRALPRDKYPEQRPDLGSRSVSPTQVFDVLPAQSQLDPETLAALPEDVRAEVLAFYRKPNQNRVHQALLPQSPRKNRTIKQTSKKLTRTPTKKRGGFLSRVKPSGRGDTFHTLTQSNFVATRPTAQTDTRETTPPAETCEIPSDFLAALPDDIRQEVLDQQRRERLRKRSGLDIAAKKKPAVRQEANPTQRRIQLPPRGPRPTFTSHRLTSLPELRDAVATWAERFEAERPVPEDVDALALYLARVVTDEGDMSKAVAVVRWLGWVVGRKGERGRRVWKEAVERVEERVQAAVAGRGLGRVEF